MQITGTISGGKSVPKNKFKYKNEMLVGTPIKDYDGTVIGTITKVDLENDLWYGFVKSNMVDKHPDASFETIR